METKDEEPIVPEGTMLEGTEVKIVLDCAELISKATDQVIAQLQNGGSS